MQQSDYDRRFEDALDGAEAVFAEKGFHGASMRDIARATGLSVAGLYYYLPSKQDALFLVCNRTFDRFEEATSGLSSLDDPKQRLHAFMREHLRYITENQGAYRVLARDIDALQDEFREKLRARRQRYFSLASDLVSQLEPKIGSASWRIAAAVLFGMLNWAPMWYRRKLDGDLDELTDKILTLFLRGVSRPTLKLEEV